MEFYFLGTGNAFGHGGRRRSHYLWKHQENWLIDASYDSLSGLRSIGLSIKDIDRIFLSHLHPDHYMGLPQFALENYYAIKKEDKIPVYCPVDGKETIRQATNLFFNEDVLDHFDHLYDFIEIGPNEMLDFGSGTLETLKADHTGNARMQIISFGDTSLGYTGDTAFVPENFERLLECTFTITEASSGVHPIPYHTTLVELQKYQIPQDKFVYISHVGETTIDLEETISPPLYLVEDGMKIIPDQL